MYLRSSLHFTLAKMALAKGHSSKTKSQLIDIGTIGPLVKDFTTYGLGGRVGLVASRSLRWVIMVQHKTSDQCKVST